jgi:hypothetical protein
MNSKGQKRKKHLLLGNILSPVFQSVSEKKLACFKQTIKKEILYAI